MKLNYFHKKSCTQHLILVFQTFCRKLVKVKLDDNFCKHCLSEFLFAIWACHQVAIWLGNWEPFLPKPLLFKVWWPYVLWKRKSHVFDVFVTSCGHVKEVLYVSIGENPSSLVITLPYLRYCGREDRTLFICLEISCDHLIKGLMTLCLETYYRE